jgi:CRP-like cAMP-binding protein
MAQKRTTPFDTKTFLTKVGGGKTILKAGKNHVLFSQGDAADSVFHILEGKVKITVVSAKGKEAVVAILESADFFGEACLTGQIVRTATATSMVDSTIVRIDKNAMIRVLREEPTFSGCSSTIYLLATFESKRTWLINSSIQARKRLARILLLLAHYGKGSKAEPIIPKVSQETLAEMVGTTRSRVSFFMNKFRKLGLIEYNGGLRIHSSLLNVVLHD